MKYIKLYESHESLLKEVTDYQWLKFIEDHTQIDIPQSLYSQIISLYSIRYHSFATNVIDKGVNIHPDVSDYYYKRRDERVNSMKGEYKSLSFRLYRYDDEYWLCYTRSMSEDPKKYREEHYFIIDSDEGLPELFRKFEEIK